MSDMPSTDDPRITVRLSQADYDHLKARADELGRSLSSVVVEAIRAGAPTLPRPATKVFSRAAAAKRGYSCPIPSCDFSAPSDKAVCPEHGRKVVSGSRS